MKFEYIILYDETLHGLYNDEKSMIESLNELVKDLLNDEKTFDEINKEVQIFTISNKLDIYYTIKEVQAGVHK